MVSSGVFRQHQMNSFFDRVGKTFTINRNIHLWVIKVIIKYCRWRDVERAPSNSVCDPFGAPCVTLRPDYLVRVNDEIMTPCLLIYFEFDGILIVTINYMR